MFSSIQKWSQAKTSVVCIKNRLRTSHQDGGIDKLGTPPCTSTSKITINIEQPSLRTMKIKLNYREPRWPRR